LSAKTIVYPLFVAILLTTISCRQDINVPKPKAYLKLDYPTAEYQYTDTKLPFLFDKNILSSLEVIKKNNIIEGVNLVYKPMNASIYISYKFVDYNLDNLIKSSLSITQQHAKIAHSVSEKEFTNNISSVYGKIFDLSGPVASQIQFYATDSINHFLSGALYFNTRPNYDSIYPATRYIQNDIIRFMESIEWKK
jgi:gliding motility-associated lipoprotein GldD